MAAQIVYTDDTDAFVSWTVTDNEGQNLGWATPQIAIAAGAYNTAVWQGVAAPTQEIRLAMPLALGLPAGVYAAHLKVPNGRDFALGSVAVITRS